MKTLIMLTLLSGTDTTNCSEETIRITECESTLKSCDEAIGRCAQLVTSQQEYITRQRIVLENAEKRARELEEQRDSLWRNPIVWGLAGVVLGVGAGVYLSK
jgi:hypothetical protein